MINVKTYQIHMFIIPCSNLCIPALMFRENVEVDNAQKGKAYLKIDRSYEILTELPVGTDNYLIVHIIQRHM